MPLGWFPRVLLLVVLALLQLLHIRLFSGITLAFHEMGHLLFAWAPKFITVLMGSGFQVAIPVIVILIFYRQPDYFGMSVGGLWLAYSLWELSDYVGDARRTSRWSASPRRKTSSTTGTTS